MMLLFAARPRTRSTWPDRRFGSEAPIGRRTTSRLRRLGVNVKQISLARADNGIEWAVRYVRIGSFASFPPSRRVRFAQRADIRAMPAFISTHTSARLSGFSACGFG